MFNFGEGHKEYIRRCRFCTFNILEGAVRSGKTVDNVFAFAQELKTTPDKIHLATGSTMGNAKLNIGDANGFGLEWIFRGQCHWGKYKDMEALIINGPYTNFKQKVVIFAGASSSDSFKKIRGNSYGMWIATEINLHHDTAIKEAFNRQLAAKNRKIFWDMNPEHPKAPIYENYLDVYDQKAKDGTLKGGYNYAHFTIFENVNITKERLEEIVSQYDENSIWYVRDILGKRSIAEGLVYTQFASLAAMANNPMKITVAQAQEMIKRNELQGITIGVDFGGNGSGHSFVASAPTVGYKGTCGSPYSNTNGKEPFKFLGIEFALGQYVVRSDVILNGVYDADADIYQQEIYTCYDCKYFATAINEHYKKLGYVIPDSGNAWKYIKNLGFDVNFPHIRMASEYGGDSNKRFGDAVHTGTRANGTREFLSLGDLRSWSVAGLRVANLYFWLGVGAWYFSARPSLTGRRGSVVDWASSMGVNLAA